MASTVPGSRIRLGQILAAGIPLGPFGGAVLVFYASASGSGRLHGDPQCRMLRSAFAVETREVELGLAVGDLCGHCAWSVPPGHPLIDFVGAVSAVAGLATWIGSRPGSDVDTRAGESAEAGAAIAGGCPEQRAEGPRQATGVRDPREQHRRQWRRLQTSMLASHAATRAYPCLRPWAEPLQAALADVIERRREALAALLDVGLLVEAACAVAMPMPAPAAGPEFAGLGVDVRGVLEQAWLRWQRTVASSWNGLEDGRAAATAVLYEAFGRRRKGRAEALAALDDVIAGWTARGRARAAQHQDGPRRVVTVQVPPVTRDNLTGAELDPLTLWEAGVLATHQVSVYWPAGSLDLLLPQPIAEHLLGRAEPAHEPDRLAPIAAELPGRACGDYAALPRPGCCGGSAESSMSATSRAPARALTASSAAYLRRWP